MRYCERCGIAFDDAGTWCRDCNEVEGVDNLWRKRGPAGLAKNRSSDPEWQAILEARAQAIRDQWLNNRSDIEAAEILGISPATVLRWRKRLGLPATNHGGIRGKSPREQERDIERIRAYGLAGAGLEGNKRAKELGVGWFAHKRGNTTQDTSEDTTK